MTYQVLARKWRPRTFQEIVGQEPILRMLTNALNQQRLHHAYLFTGTRGVGKTTLARILAKCLNCEIGITSTPCGRCKICTSIDAGRFLDLLEVDAASRTKVEDTRELLDNVHYQPTQGRYKIYLIDEVHMLSGHSFNALLKTLEEPPPYIKFLLATTDPKRLPITVLSRCLQFNLKRVTPEKITDHLAHLCTAEKIAYDMPALQLLAQAADGSMRDALSLLDQAIAFCHNDITTLSTQQMLGSIDQNALFRLLQALADNNSKKLWEEMAALAEHAPDFQQALEDVLSILHKISIAQLCPDIPEHNESIQQLAARFTAEDVQLYYQIALIGRRDLPLAPRPQQGFEMVMLRMLAFRPVINNAQVVPITLTTSSSPKNRIETEEKSYKWPDILTKLGLSGMAYALALNCTLEKITADKVSLLLATQHGPMLNKKLTEKIEQALIHYLGHPLKLEITLVSSEIHTPAKQQQEEQTLRHASATTAIQNDGHVQKIMGLFDATLDVNSIKAVNPESEIK